MNHQYQRRHGDVRNRLEITHAVGHLATHIGQQPQAATVDQQRIAIGRGLGRNVAYDYAAGAVVHHDLLAETVSETLRYKAGSEIAAPARLRRDQAYGFGGKLLCAGCNRHKGQAGNNQIACIGHGMILCAR